MAKFGRKLWFALWYGESFSFSYYILVIYLKDLVKVVFITCLLIAIIFRIMGEPDFDFHKINAECPLVIYRRQS